MNPPLPPDHPQTDLAWKSTTNALGQPVLGEWFVPAMYNGRRVIDVSVCVAWLPKTKGSRLHLVTDAYVDENDWSVLIGKSKCRRNMKEKGFLAFFFDLPVGYTPLSELPPDIVYCETCTPFFHMLGRGYACMAKAHQNSEKGVALRPIEWTSTITYGVEEDDSLPDDGEDDDDEASGETDGQVRILRQAGG